MLTVDLHSVLLALWKNLVSAVLGSGLTIGVFLRFGQEYFFKRLTKKYDQEMAALTARYNRELKRLETQLERSTFVTKAQFDTEFATYKEIFSALADMRRAIEATRPVLRLAPEDEKKEERDEETGARFMDLVLAHRRAATTVENARPFYEPSIYELTLKCLQAANLELFQMTTANYKRYSADWYLQAEKNQASYLATYGKVADQIRQRIDSLAVLPGS
jgi:hypothetical protein